MYESRLVLVEYSNKENVGSVFFIEIVFEMI